MGIKQSYVRLQLTEEQVQDIFDNLDGEGSITEDGVWEFVADDDWASEGKYENSSPILKHVPTGKYYQALLSRTGSYYTDYDYQYPDTLFEVEEVKVTTTVWKRVKCT